MLQQSEGVNQEFPRKEWIQHKNTKKEVHDESHEAGLGGNCPDRNIRGEAFGERNLVKDN